MTLLVGVVGALTFATAAGARRTSSALDRFQADSRSADIEIDARVTPETMRRIEGLRGVAEVAPMLAYAAVLPQAPDFFSIGVPTDDRYGRNVDRDRIIAGRPLDPAVVGEVTIGEGMANRLGIKAGDSMGAESFTVPQVEGQLKGSNTVGLPAGPKLQLHVVGIVRRPLDLGERTASGGLLVISPATAKAYHGQIGVFGTRLRIRTDHGAADVPGVLAAARNILGPDLFSAQSLTVQAQGARNAIDVLTTALWLAALMAALAGTATIAIVLARESALVGADYEQLRDLGCTRLQRAAVAGPSALVIGGAGAILAIGGAIALSPLLPLGVARRADPDVGLHADWLILLLGAAATVAAVLAVAAIAAYRATSPYGSLQTRSPRARRSTIAERMAVAGAAPTTTNGIRMAFEPGRGRTAVPVRSAFIGAIIGAMGATGVGVFTASLHHLAQRPAAYGSAWDFRATAITTATRCNDPDDFGLSKDPGIASLTEICTQNVDIEGRPVNAVAYTRLRGDPIEPAIIEGRAPRTANEVALGTKTLADLHRHIGDPVRVRGRSATKEYEIVGRAVFPTLAAAQPLADGAAFTGEGYKPLFDHNIFLRHFVGRYAPGTDRAATAARIAHIPELDSPAAPTLPVEVDRLQQIDWLPVLLVVIFVALALIAIGHALVTGVGRRRREFALLAALGFTRGQVRGTVAVQATALATLGLLVGIPAGVVAGTLVWRAVADGLGVAVVTKIPPLAIVLIVIGSIVLANVIALLPARRAARLRPAVGLRSD
jgi:hypothetical protein